MTTLNELYKNAYNIFCSDYSPNWDLGSCHYLCGPAVYGCRCNTQWHERHFETKSYTRSTRYVSPLRFESDKINRGYKTAAEEMGIAKFSSSLHFAHA